MLTKNKIVFGWLDIKQPYGICEEHIREEWEGVDEQIEDEEHQKLVKAFKQAIRETEEEKKAVKCFFGPL